MASSAGAPPATSKAALWFETAPSAAARWTPVSALNRVTVAVPTPVPGVKVRDPTEGEQGEAPGGVGRAGARVPVPEVRASETWAEASAPEVIRLPKASSMATTGWGERATPATAPPGWVVKASWAAAAWVMSKVVDVPPTKL